MTKYYAFPTITVGQEPEEIAVHTSGTTTAGYGSTNTAIRRYTTTAKNTLNLLGTYADSSANGASVTVNARCMAYVTMDWTPDAVEAGGISLNSDELTTNIISLSSVEDRMGHAVPDSSSAGAGSCVTATFEVKAGDVIRPHAHPSSSHSSRNARNSFRVVLVPIEGQRNQAAIISNPICFIEDRKASGVPGGGSNATPEARVLNVATGDISDGGLTFPVDGTSGIGGTNTQFTLAAGKYCIEWSCPAYDPASHVTALYNVSNSSYIKMGTSEYQVATDNIQTRSHGQHLITITSATTFAIYHEVQTAVATNGWGVSAGGTTSIDDTLGYEVYSQVKITRLK